MAGAGQGRGGIAWSALGRDGDSRPSEHRAPLQRGPQRSPASVAPAGAAAATELVPGVAPALVVRGGVGGGAVVCSAGAVRSGG